MSDYEKRLQDVVEQVDVTNETGCADGLLDALDNLCLTPRPKEREMRDGDKELREAVERLLKTTSQCYINVPFVEIKELPNVAAALDNAKGKPTVVEVLEKVCVFEGQKRSDGRLEYENGWADAVLEFRKHLEGKDE